MRVQVRQSAPEGDRFGPDAFAAQVGKEIDVQINGREGGRGTLLGAQVVEDGAAVLLTLDVIALGAPR